MASLPYFVLQIVRISFRQTTPQAQKRSHDLLISFTGKLITRNIIYLIL